MSKIKILNVFEKILSREYFLYFSVFYLFTKLFSIFQTSIFTYVMFFWGVFCFFYNRIIKKDLFFPCAFYSYGIIFISLISVLFNGYLNFRKLVVDLIPIFINLFLFFPTLKDDNYDKLKKLFQNINLSIFFIGAFVSMLNLIHLFKMLIFYYTLNFDIILPTRLFGVLGNPNLVGWFSLVYLGSIMFFLKSKNKIIIYISLFLCLTNLILSFCRSAYLSIFVYFIFYILTTRKFNLIFKKHKNIFFILIFLFVILFLIILSLIANRGGSGRIDIYKFAIYEYLKYNKLIGLSYGMLRDTWVKDYENLFGEKANGYIQEANSHNIFLQQLITNGLIGLIILLSFVYIIIKKILFFINNLNDFSDENLKFIKNTIYYIIIGFVVGMFDNSILQSMTLFINFMFLVSAGIFLKIMKN